MRANSFRLWNLRTLLLAGASLALPGVLHAQTTVIAENSNAPAATSQSSVEEVVVTARRKNERILDVPVAITALDTKALAAYSTNDISQVGTLIPQVMFTRNPSGNGANINIRGVGTNTSADNGVEQAVSVNIDGVPTARGRILLTGLFDVSEVQVLKGPQALYFGKNSPGGTIVVDSNGPTDQMEGYVRAGYETSAREYRGEAAVGGPITDTFGFRVAITGSDMTGGYVHNIAQPISPAADPIGYDQAHGLGIPGKAFEWGPNSKFFAGRLSLRWAPTNNFDASFKFMGSTYRDQGDSSQNVLAHCANGGTNESITDLSSVFTVGHPIAAVDPNSYCGGNKRVNDIGELPAAMLNGLPFNKGDSEYGQTTTYLSSLTMNYHLDHILLTSVTGFYKYDTYTTSFFDATELALAGGLANSFNTSWDQELRVVTSFDSPVNFTGGVYYGHDQRTEHVGSDIIRYVDPVTGDPLTAIGHMTNNGHTWSTFGELSWKILPNLELAGGARYSSDVKDGTLQNDYVSWQGLLFHVALPPGIVANPHVSDSNVSPQATLTWHATPNSSLYAGYRTGFLAGTISNPGLIAASVTSQSVVVNPEKSKGFEAGYKFQTDDHRFSGDMAIYDYKYSNLQVSAFSSVTNTVQTVNAGESEVKGVELNLNFRATPELTIHGAAGYNHGRFTNFVNAGCWGGQTVAQGCVANQQNLTGQALPRAPDWAGTIGLAWDHSLTQDLMLGLTVDGRFTSKYNFVATNNPFAIQSGYGVLDASVRLYQPDNHWELALIGRNLTDEFYYTVGSEVPLGTSPGSVMGVPGLPRTLLIQATYRY